MGVYSRADANTIFIFFTRMHDHGTTIVSHWSAHVLLWQLASSVELRKILMSGGYPL